MLNLKELFGRKGNPTDLDIEKMAGLLSTSPEKMTAFEESYHIYGISEKTDNYFEKNAKQLSKETKTEDLTDSALINRIVEELAAITPVFCWDGKQKITVASPDENAIPDFVKAEELNKIPKEFRPQLSAECMARDIAENAYPTILMMYWKYKDKGQSEKSRRTYYHLFRQGLDIQDMDPIMYQIIDQNPNSMGNWFPQLAKAVTETDTWLRIPKTTIAKIPMTMVQLTRKDYFEINETTKEILNRYCQKIFQLETTEKYFIRTGSGSSKQDFRNAKVTDPEEIKDIGEYLLFIHGQQCMMASPLNNICIYGAGTTVEWVVREFIEDTGNHPTIYHGLPLRTEYRIFADMDTNEIIGQSPYWEPETMKKRFAQNRNGHDVHDAVTYRAQEKHMLEEYHDNIEKLSQELKRLLPQIDLSGQYSIDIMQNGHDFYLIDMAKAEESAYYDCIPEKYRKVSATDWMPALDEKLPDR